MSSKVLNKVLLAILLIFSMLFIIQTVSSAQSKYLTPPTAQDSTLIKPVETTAGAIIAIVQVIGVSVAIIMLIILAIKYVSSAPNDRAEIKKHAVVYVVGAVVLFAASGILGIIRGFATTAFNVISTVKSAPLSDGSYKVTETYNDGGRKETWYDKDNNIVGWRVFDKDGNETERR